MLSHPNIVSVYDVARSGGLDYIVMELIDGHHAQAVSGAEGPASTGARRSISPRRSPRRSSTPIQPRHCPPRHQAAQHHDPEGRQRQGRSTSASRASPSAQSTLTREALGSVHYISPEQAKGASRRRRGPTSIPSASSCTKTCAAGRTPYRRRHARLRRHPEHINGGAAAAHARSTPVSRAASSRSRCTPWPPMLDERYTTATEMLADLEEFRRYRTRR